MDLSVINSPILFWFLTVIFQMKGLLVKVLRPTQRKIGHFGDVPQANLLVGMEETKPNTTKTHIHQSKQIYYNTK